jgi:mannose-6-phosphate isomerase-like protein (cupin superfamily)
VDQTNNNPSPTHEQYFLAKDAGDAYWFLGTLMTVKAGGDATNQGFTIIEQILPPGFAPPPHIHHVEEEAFYLLEGEITVTCGERTWKVTPGAFVLLPHGIAHGFKVEGDIPAKLLQITSPAGFEHFAAEIGEPTQTLTLPPPSAPDIAKLLEVAPKYKMELLIPPEH